MDPVTERAIKALGHKMAPDTGRLPDKPSFFQRSRPDWIGLLRLFLCLLVGLLPVKSALAMDKDVVLEASGIHYPGGYDPHTVGEVRGKVAGLIRPSQGPVRFELVSDRETYTVLASPSWYWNDSQFKPFEGQDVVVRGSKSLGKDGRLYIISQEISIPASGKSVELRGADGTPLWKGSARSGWGGSGGGGSPGAGRGGGVGGGFGGGGRGRR